MMKLSCGLIPTPDVVRLARSAERLGYERVWLPDSPVLYGDVWIAIARILEGTERLGAGTAVLVPHLRHVVVTAAAIGTIEQLAPGRLEVALGTGFTARAMMGKPPLTWKYMESYVRALQALLAGEEATVDGAVVTLLHPDRLLARRPIRTPLLLASNGTRGIEMAQRLGLGHMCAGLVPSGAHDSRFVAFGTVLDDGETFQSDAVFERLAPNIAVLYHAAYGASREAVDNLPGGAGWRAALEAVPERVRHLYLHEGHLVEVSVRERPHLSRDLGVMTFSGTRAEMRQKVADLAAAGVSEFIFWPGGRDLERELRAMAEAMAAPV
ncbi:MAG: LLM class flavin-dependent oxidoreductase [Candidatus Binatia bacterium]